MSTTSPPATLRAMLDDARGQFAQARRTLSFDEFLDMAAGEPERHTRDAARYLRDMIDHYGTVTLERPYGTVTRWKVFDLPWEDPVGQRDGLVGQEAMQAEVYRAISNFARQGRVNRLVLLHGPNGSAKSTLAACLMRALENYSSLEEGALYRFHWVFPRGRGGETGRIGFGGVTRDTEGPKPGESYAHLEEGAIEAKVLCEVRDHPLLLLPTELRQRVLREMGVHQNASEMFWRGGLCHKCEQIAQALLSAYRGDIRKMLAHVQVERWQISRRYRVGATVLGPQMAVDAKERQVTASRSLAALPPSLQNMTLFEPFGELIDAAGGLIEYADLLKRPLEAWKYLLLMIETGEVSLTTSNLAPNVVMIGSSNEIHLDAFREHPDFASFRGRLELVRSPYLLDWRAEQSIYDNRVLPSVRRHVAPHATELAAVFAVLSRMRRPTPERFSKSLGALVADLSPIEKAELYASATIPQRFSAESSKELHAAIGALYHESDTAPSYEGRMGASAREIQGLLLDAAQHPGYKCLSPFAVLDHVQQLCLHRSEFEWLKQEPAPNGYYDPKYFQKVLRDRLNDRLEDAMRTASGLVEESRYVDAFERYVLNVSAWLKGEKIANRLTGRDEPADEAMMRDTEKTLGNSTTADEFRKNLISAVAAWAIDHPGERVVYPTLFPRYVQKLKDAWYAERRKQLVSITREVLRYVSDDREGMDADATARTSAVLGRLYAAGYCEHCARDAAVALLKDRFADGRP